ncbi:MAG: protease inhibitor I42 family protein [Synergistetes bacterium]|nr:protease inhibitor I42 family protein [Synergistota bacterium]
MKISLFLSVLIGIVFFTFLAFAQSDFDIVTLKEEDKGSEITLRNRDVLVILLKEVSTAGYKWDVVNFDRDKLLFIQSKSLKLSPPGLLGGPNLRIFVFKAVGLGRTPIQIVYHRPWENLGYPQKVFYVEANIIK